MFDDFWSGLTNTIGDIGTTGKDFLTGNWGNLGGDVSNIFSLPQSTSEAPLTNVNQQIGGDYLSRATTPQSEAMAQLPASQPITGGGGDTTTKSPNWLSSAMNAVGGPMNAGILGMLAMNALSGPNTATAEKTLSNQARIPNQVAQQQYNQYQSGQLTVSDQQALDQWHQQQKAQIDDYYAKAGASDSSSHVEALNQLQQQVIAKADAMKQAYLSNAMSASQTGGQIMSTLAQIQQSGDAAQSQAASNLMLAMFGGMRGGKAG